MNTIQLKKYNTNIQVPSELKNNDTKLLFLDLDGTLIFPGTYEMPVSTQKVLQKARENGHKAIICTGRNMGLIRPVLKYGFDGIIASAGGYIQIGEEILSDIKMPEEEQRLAFKVLRENNIYIQPEAFDKMFVDEKIYELYQNLSETTGDSELIRMRKQCDSSLGCLPLKDYQNEAIYKILYICCDAKNFEIPEKILSEKYFFLKHPIDKNGMIHGELINRRVGKGKALKIVTEYFHRNITDTIAFGDSMNDAEMMEEAGFSVSMGNAPLALKELSDYVCPSQSDDGIKDAFLKLGLVK